jgi:hypothetical protein
MKSRVLIALALLAFATLPTYAENNDDKKTTSTTVKVINVDKNLEILSTSAKAVRIEKKVPWEARKVIGVDVPPLDFRFGEGARLSAALILDTSETKEDVYEKYVRPLENLAKVDPDRHRPAIVLVTWGLNKHLKGVVESVDVTYTGFLSDGRPSRAEVVLSVRETDTASAAL